MLSQVLEDMSAFKGLQIAEKNASSLHYLQELFPPDQRQGDPLADMDASSVPLDMNQDTPFGLDASSSFHIHHDADNTLSVSLYSPVFAGGDGISRIGRLSGASTRQGGARRESTGSAMSFEASFEEDSVESYSRIAGRLSLDSTMSNN